MVLIYILMGLVLGSFMSVIVFRMGVKEGIVAGRSECTRCLVRLKWYDLVPLLSFLSLRGKCRYCRVKISFIYPAMELAAAAMLGSYCFLNWPCLALNNFYQSAILFIFLVLFFFDFVHYILPDKLIISALAISIPYVVFFQRENLSNSFITALALSSFFAILYIGSKGKWMGFGDVKLAFLIGFVLGYPAGLSVILISIWAGALWGIGLMLSGRANLKTQLPFGSFMAGVAIIYIIFQNHEIWNIGIF